MSAILATLTATVLLAVSPASANMMSATFTTTLTKGVDYTSYFGSPGATTLAGQTVTIEFIYDTSLGVDTSSPTQMQRRGGSDFRAGLFILSTTVTIGGTSLGIQSRNQQIWNVVPSSAPSTAGTYGFSTDDLVYQPGGISGALASRDSVAISASGPGISVDLTKPGSYVLDSVSASIMLTEFGPPYGWKDARYNVAANAFGPGKLVVRELAPVSTGPEPRIWALMLSGIGAIGYVVGRRTYKLWRIKQMAAT